MLFFWFSVFWWFMIYKMLLLINLCKRLFRLKICIYLNFFAFIIYIFHQTFFHVRKGTAWLNQRTWVQSGNSCWQCLSLLWLLHQEDVPRHEGEDRRPGPPPAVLHRHGHRARGQQEIQVSSHHTSYSFNSSHRVAKLQRLHWFCGFRRESWGGLKSADSCFSARPQAAELWERGPQLESTTGCSSPGWSWNVLTPCRV